MDAYCTAKLNDSLSKLSSEDKTRQTDQAFFSLKLHTCVQVEVISDPKDAGAMNYIVSDLTYGFVAPPKWHHNETHCMCFKRTTAVFIICLRRAIGCRLALSRGSSPSQRLTP
jgi:hypothetical protein